MEICSTEKSPYDEHGNHLSVTGVCACTCVTLEGSFDCDDPLFMIELDSEKQVLTVRTFCQLVLWQNQVLQQSFEEWTKGKVDKKVFSGHDILEVVHLINDLRISYKIEDTIHKVKCPGSNNSLWRRYGWMLEATEDNMEKVEVKSVVDVEGSSEDSDGEEGLSDSSGIQHHHFYILRSSYASEGQNGRSSIVYDHVIGRVVAMKGWQAGSDVKEE